MAEINTFLKVGKTHYHRNNAKVPYLAEVKVDFAKVPEGVEANDTIGVLFIPAGTLVGGIGIQTIEATDSSVDIGLGTEDDPVEFATGVDLSVGDGEYAPISHANELITEDMTLIVTVESGTATAGSFRVFAQLTDVTPIPAPGLAKPGS